MQEDNSLIFVRINGEKITNRPNRSIGVGDMRRRQDCVYGIAAMRSGIFCFAARPH
jgi:hypothetical protein